MSNRERARQPNILRHAACRIGTRTLKLRVNKLMKMSFRRAGAHGLYRRAGSLPKDISSIELVV